jgi:hypothetical protein
MRTVDIDEVRSGSDRLGENKNLKNLGGHRRTAQPIACGNFRKAKRPRLSIERSTKLK